MSSDQSQGQKSPSSSLTEPALSSNAPADTEADPEVDGLDDILDDFSRPSPRSRQSSMTKAAPLGPPIREDSSSEDVNAEAFAKQLQDQMSAFMNNAGDPSNLQLDLENVLQSIATTSPAHDPGIKPESVDDGFQSTINRTIERMRLSEEKLDKSSVPEDADHLLSQILRDLPHDGLGKGDDSQNFDQMLLQMMEQLTDKEILYEPMKELRDKYPLWLEENEARTQADDLRRYREQKGLVDEIVQRFERPGYSDSNAPDREFIVGKMQQMQAAGSPPADLIGGMGAVDALSDVESCAQQ